MVGRFGTKICFRLSRTVLRIVPQLPRTWSYCVSCNTYIHTYCICWTLLRISPKYFDVCISTYSSALASIIHYITASRNRLSARSSAITTHKRHSSTLSDSVTNGFSICLMPKSPQRTLSDSDHEVSPLDSQIYVWKVWRPRTSRDYKRRAKGVGKRHPYQASAIRASKSFTIFSRLEDVISPSCNWFWRSRIYFLFPLAPSKTSLPRQSLWKACWQGNTKNWRLRTGNEHSQHFSPGSTMAYLVSSAAISWRIWPAVWAELSISWRRASICRE